MRLPGMIQRDIDHQLVCQSFEPIAQIVYRGSSTVAPGITNDNALSFVFDDTNLFSYDRFTGSDRQETGLRANIGGRYMANFGDGTWLDAGARDARPDHDGQRFAPVSWVLLCPARVWVVHRIRRARCILRRSI